MFFLYYYLQNLIPLLTSFYAVCKIVIYLFCSSKEFGNSVFHTGTRTDDPDSSSSEESDIETQLSSGEEEEVNETPKQSSSYVSFQVGPLSLAVTLDLTALHC